MFGMLLKASTVYVHGNIIYFIHKICRTENQKELLTITKSISKKQNRDLLYAKDWLSSGKMVDLYKLAQKYLPFSDLIEKIYTENMSYR